MVMPNSRAFALALSAGALTLLPALVACHSKSSSEGTGNGDPAPAASNGATANGSGSGAGAGSASEATGAEATAAGSGSGSGSGSAAKATGGGGTFAAWLRERVPAGSDVVANGSDAPKVMHKVEKSDTALSIATAYLDLTDIYFAKDLAIEIGKKYPHLTPGEAIEIPHLLAEPYKDPEHDRLGWPEGKDRGLRGVFITGFFASQFWPNVVEKVAARTPTLNAIVLDAKDYEGPVTYPSKIQLAKDMGATREWIPDFARAVRYAHAKGVRVIARIACFHDPLAAKKSPRLSLMGKWGKPFPMGWIDPMNPEARQYVFDLTKEAIANGVDEIQLDYIRFPVSAEGIDSVVMPPPHGQRSKAIKDLVHEVHEITRAHNVPLSLDIFGVTATGDQDDIERLGQDIGTIGGEAEALSPMVYPSHYADGYRGWDHPGNHPEIVGIGTKMALDKLKAGHHSTTFIRSWLQASNYKSTNYGPKYLLDEMKSAESNGGVGWLLWNPGNDYEPLWRAIPANKDSGAVAGR
jgi:hypothetical protein